MMDSLFPLFGLSNNLRLSCRLIESMRVNDDPKVINNEQSRQIKAPIPPFVDILLIRGIVVRYRVAVEKSKNENELVLEHHTKNGLHTSALIGLVDFGAFPKKKNLEHNNITIIIR